MLLILTFISAPPPCAQDPFEISEVSIGHQSEGYDIIDGMADGRRKAPQYGMTLKTPSRDYYLNAASIPEYEAWLRALKIVVTTEDDQTMM